MCGIHLSVSPSTNPASPYLGADLERRLRSRGPDHFGRVETRCGRSTLVFTSTVLALRGESVTPQPFEHGASGSVLCWNGEAWKIGGRPVRGNDGAVLFELLVRWAVDGAAADVAAREQRFLDVLRSVQGPFAVIFFDKPSGRLYFARDRLGRRSVVASHDVSNGSLFISSIAAAHGTASTGAAAPAWQEVEADGVYVLDLVAFSKDPSSTPAYVRHAWTSPDGGEEHISGIGPFNDAVSSGNQGPSSALLPRESAAVRSLREHLTESLRLRVLHVPKPLRPPHANASDATDTRVAVLFSGGLDCTVLARLCHDLIPSDQGVDLLNVAFENPRVAAQLQARAAGGDSGDVCEACPDRLTGRQSFAELVRTCPGRAWRFVAVNVLYTETMAHRGEVVSLIHPHNTEMDLSIAYALYFAARGQGVSVTGSARDGATLTQAHYSTPARVLLSGLGADELFGGYLRHATAFSRHGYRGLANELRLDVSRLGKRNLGRDDRAMSHWGREVRFPFLDEQLVRWAIAEPAWAKCDFGNLGHRLEPAKRVLRLLADELGLPEVAKEKKRAIQFGSRTAKMESGKVKGTALIS